MESNLDLTKILKDAGASIIQRRPEHANLIEYRVQFWDNVTTSGRWAFSDNNVYTFAQAKLVFLDLEERYHPMVHRIVAIVEVK